MHWAVRLCCTVVAFSPVFCFAQATVPDQPTAFTAAASSSAPDAEPEFPFARPLPDGVAPNPPQPLYLQGKQLTWKGEYEFDKLGRPVLDTNGRVIPILYTKKGHRTRPSGVQLLKTHPASIEDGTLIVDGWTGKARLNYDIQDLRYLYVSIPSVGTVIVSPSAFPGGEQQSTAFNDTTLSVHAGDHLIQITTTTPILGKKAPQPAWVRLEPEFTADHRYPIVGYGNTLNAPFDWPGARLAKDKGTTSAPPLPVSMMPKMAKPVCIAQPGKPCASVNKMPASSLVSSTSPALN